jgi:hypothetical protein
MHVSQAEFPSLEKVGQLLVIDAHPVTDAGVQIMD